MLDYFFLLSISICSVNQRLLSSFFLSSLFGFFAIISSYNHPCHFILCYPSPFASLYTSDVCINLRLSHLFIFLSIYCSFCYLDKHDRFHDSTPLSFMTCNFLSVHSIAVSSLWVSFRFFTGTIVANLYLVFLLRLLLVVFPAFLIRFVLFFFW